MLAEQLSLDTLQPQLPGACCMGAPWPSQLVGGQTGAVAENVMRTIQEYCKLWTRTLGHTWWWCLLLCWRTGRGSCVDGALPSKLSHIMARLGLASGKSSSMLGDQSLLGVANPTSPQWLHLLVMYVHGYTFIRTVAEVLERLLRELLGDVVG